MKRYDLYTDEVTGDTFEQEDALGYHVRFVDADAMRRRLLVKLCRERACRLFRLSNEPVSHGQARRDIWLRCGRWFVSIADTIESNQPLTYFQRLGEDK